MHAVTGLHYGMEQQMALSNLNRVQDSMYACNQRLETALLDLQWWPQRQEEA